MVGAGQSASIDDEVNTPGTQAYAGLLARFAANYVVDAETYGKGDGTDVSAHVQALVAAAKAGSVFSTESLGVYMPPGEYDYLDTVPLDFGDYVSFAGAGSGLTVINAPNVVGGPGMRVPQTGAGPNGPGGGPVTRIADFTIRGTLSASVGCTTQGVS